MTVDFAPDTDDFAPWIRQRLADLADCDVAGVGLDESLIGAGIDSLTMMRLAAELQSNGIEIGFADLLARPTLQGWVEVLRDRTSSAAVSDDVPGEDTSSAPFPLTSVQHAYWIGRRDAAEMGGVGCHAYFEFDCADIDPPRLRSAVTALVERHDMLRASFTTEGTQRVLPSVDVHPFVVDDLRDMSAESIDVHLATTRDRLSHRVLEVERGEVFGVRLIRLPSGRSKLIVDIDLLVADVLSVQIVLSDLASFYARPGVSLPEIGVSFSSYVAERARRGDSERAAAYWRDRLAEIPRAPELPLAKAPSDVSHPRFTRRSARLTADQWQRLRGRSRAAGVTPSVVVATAFANVLARWSGQPRLLLNLPIFDRRSSHPDIPLMVADFTDLVLLDVDLTDELGFADQTRRVQGRFQKNAAHTDYSGVDVLRDLTRFHGDSFTAPVVFASNIGRDLVDKGFREHLGELEWMISQTPQCWLDHQLYDDEYGLEAVWDAVDELFPANLLDDMFAAYITLLQHLSSDETSWDEPARVDLPLRHRQVRDRVNDTESSIPTPLLHEPVFARAEIAPESVAVIGCDRTLSYGELAARATRIAEVLIENGCSAGDHIGVLSDKGWEQVVSVLGVLAAGCVYVPLGPDQPPERRDTILADAGIKQILTQSWLEMADCSVRERFPVHDVDLLGPAERPLEGVSARSLDDLAYVIYTSGSTGVPKGVMISHRSAANTIGDINLRYRVDHTDRGLGLAGLGFDLSVYDVFGLLSVGGALVLPSPERRGDPSHWAELIEDHGVTVWNSVPAQMVILDEYLSEQQEPSSCSLRLALLSGDWIPVSLPDSIRTVVPNLELHGLGGATEAAIWSIAHEIRDVDPAWRSIPYGRPLANQSFHVLDAQLRDSPEWVPGELYIGGTGLAQGYIGDPEKTAERFLTHLHSGERLYRTGDLGRYLPDGTLEFLGRTDSQVKIRGHRIEPAEIETVLERHTDVAQARVVVDGTDPLDRHLNAFVTPARVAEPSLPPFDEVYASARAAAESTVSTTSMDGVGFFASLLEDAVLTSIAGAMGRLVPETLTGRLTVQEIEDRAEIDPRHRRLLRRWLTALSRAGMLHRDEAGDRYHSLLAVTDREFDAAWGKVLARPDTRLWPEAVIRLFHTSARHLEPLMRGEVDQVHLLFPDGDSSTAIAAFTESTIARYLNEAVATLLGELAARHQGDAPFRILEIGAGVGGTSEGAFAALEPYDVDYLFTDVSPYFLEEAASRFADRNFVHYSLYDMELNLWSQGLQPNSFDAIVAANVLHNTRDVRDLLGRIKELLTPGGRLVFTELTDEIPEMLISMEFLAGAADHANEFTDERATSDDFIFSAARWTSLLEEAGGTDLRTLPSTADDMSGLGQELLVATFKTDRRNVSTESLFDHLAHRLPSPMLPERIEVIDAIPMTPNGKVDHATLVSHLRAGAQRANTASYTAPSGDLETRIARVWADCLAIDAVPRDQDFFALGGDSLLIARLAARMRTEVPELQGREFDALLACLMSRETVADIAASAVDTTQEHR